MVLGILILALCGPDTRESLEQNVWSIVHLGGDVHHHTGPIKTTEKKPDVSGTAIRGSKSPPAVTGFDSDRHEEKVLYIPKKEGSKDATPTTEIPPKENENPQDEKPQVTATAPPDEKDESNSVDDNNTKISSNESINREKIQEIRNEFYTRYGGKEEATSMLQRGIETMKNDEETHDIPISHTAERILQAQQQTSSSTFTMAFGGYSVTVGRGNHFEQSYPFIMQAILKPIFEEYFHLDLVVRNSAIGGIPSFPYGFCLPNFLGDDADVVSWDYGMNEGNGAEAFEAYVRQSISTFSKRPMMIMLDKKRPRIDLLKSYFENGALLDSIAVGQKGT